MLRHIFDNLPTCFHALNLATNLLITSHSVAVLIRHPISSASAKVPPPPIHVRESLLTFILKLKPESDLPDTKSDSK